LQFLSRYRKCPPDRILKSCEGILESAFWIRRMRVGNEEGDVKSSAFEEVK
jgi:hypothetical protein